MKKTTKIKLIKKIELQLCDDQMPEEEKTINLNYLTCKSCHWQFYGDMVRFGHGHSSEYRQLPYFCPGCGIKTEFAKNKNAFRILTVNMSHSV